MARRPALDEAASDPPELPACCVGINGNGVRFVEQLFGVTSTMG